MKHKSLLTLLLLMLWSGLTHAQKAVDTYKDPAAAADTIQIKGLIIIKSKNDKGRNSYKFYSDTAYARNKLKKNLQTRFFVFDIGFNNYIDRSDYTGAAYVNYFSGVNQYTQLAAANKAAYSYSAVGLATMAPRSASEPLTPSEFKLITGKSINFNIWLLEQRLNITKHKLNLLYAVGLEMNNYRYARNITYEPGYPTTIIRDSIEFSKNKLFAEYISIPVMLNFNSNPARPARAFQASFGVQGGYLLKGRTKQVSDERGKVRKTDDFNLNKWRFGLASELGYGPVKLYANFALTALHDYGLQQYPFSIGLRLNGF
ncbi:Outer membrane protein beta-barrel domain-containing protein [Chitinophaga jiangningensis]|uniref:Outer membrane protein beta-barrel domain-containing protein n=1 Tax=Chitinophaga jiangningensis TaxID=1419482 RepID=A0A1M7HWE8_9BACT|nr:outer membrane beta-barrel protein [Chitinophaga jiangningensis]SHM32748.1 Outer membrane protein beta-barrel domain-containing protein [Chitinophaga jiangningensis]